MNGGHIVADDLGWKDAGFLADQHPQIVAELQKRIEGLARESAKPLFLVDAFGSIKAGAHGPPALPNEDRYFTQGD
jgi:hypothetical protein